MSFYFFDDLKPLVEFDLQSMIVINSETILIRFEMRKDLIPRIIDHHFRKFFKTFSDLLIVLFLPFLLPSADSSLASG